MNWLALASQANQYVVLNTEVGRTDLYKELLEDNNGNKELADSKCSPNKVYRYWKVSKFGSEKVMTRSP